ncbi:MAG: hypothetical protein GKR89_05970 [Candidatus Latescibacteria bacterium]|nr:hypothetical protein [Candidatus Latescibacterota bacterium]
MNLPPASGIRVPLQILRDWVTALFAQAGMPAQDAELMAQLLVLTDQRGVFSHGTQAAPGYISMIQSGRVNPTPQLEITAQTDTTLVIDGDGGMGHLPSHRAMSWAVTQAKKHGLAAATTGNHFHFGGAGKYSRLALEQDCIGIAVSSHRFQVPSGPGTSILNASGGSPFSIAIPAGQQPPFVPDMGTGFVPWEEDLFQRFPWIYFKSVGLAATMQALGGILAGIYRPQVQEPISQWKSNQGGFFTVFDVSCFMDIDEFKAEMDRYIGQVRSTEPLPGQQRSEMAGGLEWERERDYGQNGIPVGEEHRQRLESIAAELGLDSPLGQFEHSRFSAD